MRSGDEDVESGRGFSLNSADHQSYSLLNPQIQAVA
jgi:hypothetical protein